ncbi:MAG: carbon storage regulator [Gammaproteobacteria bacterium]|nr:carbon storage regulator [Gammaproteobacteria bacterium]NIR95418.1 carbon storage regulator [Gammaproteobacteria bacterium]NIW45588.1 hypothetical protein [Gammaproteobacteria bacterium]NIX56809.1 hypothetical protein [candidate division Zixibacteria bacterium]
MTTFKHKNEEIIILRTLNGPITLNVTKSTHGDIKLSIKAPLDVMIYREDLSRCDDIGFNQGLLVN